MYTYTYTHVHEHVHTHAHTHTHTHTYIHTHVHAHAYTYTHTHTGGRRIQHSAQQPEEREVTSGDRHGVGVERTEESDGETQRTLRKARTRQSTGGQ